MKKTYMFFLLFLTAGWVFGQQMQPSAISNGGGNLSNADVKMSFTIGQSVTGLVMNSSAKVTQGFQQNYLVEPDAITEWARINLEIDVFPVPANNQLTVSIVGNIHEDLSLALFDIQGNRLVQISYPNSGKNIQLDLAEYVSGIYLLNIKLSNGEPLASYKIVKK